VAERTVAEEAQVDVMATTGIEPKQVSVGQAFGPLSPQESKKATPHVDLHTDQWP